MGISLVVITIDLINTIIQINSKISFTYRVLKSVPSGILHITSALYGILTIGYLIISFDKTHHSYVAPQFLTIFIILLAITLSKKPRPTHNTSMPSTVTGHLGPLKDVGDPSARFCSELINSALSQNDRLTSLSWPILSEFFSHYPILFFGCKLDTNNLVDFQPVYRNLPYLHAETKTDTICCLFAGAFAKIFDLMTAIYTQEACSKMASVCFTRACDLSGASPMVIDAFLKHVPDGVLDDEKHRIMSRHELEESLDKNLKQLKIIKNTQGILEEDLRKADMSLLQLVHLYTDGVVIVDAEKQIIIANPIAEELMGVAPGSLEGAEFPFQISMGQETKIDVTLPDEEKNIIELRYAEAEWKGQQVILVTMRDITQSEKVKRKLKEQALELEAMNSTLKLLLTKREEEQAEQIKNISSTINRLVLPYLQKIKNGKLTQSQRGFVSVIEQNLLDITSSFAHDLSTSEIGLSSTELEVAILIREGHSTKQIADLMSVSENTILSHRKHIRRKLGIQNKGTNLRAHLLSFRE